MEWEKLCLAKMVRAAYPERLSSSLQTFPSNDHVRSIPPANRTGNYSRNLHPPWFPMSQISKEGHVILFSSPEPSSHNNGKSGFSGISV